MRRSLRTGPFFGVSLCLALWLGGSPSAIAGQTSGSPHGPLEVACETCHTLDSWTELRRPTAFDHGAHTGFALERHHGAVACRSCHERLEFSLVPSACADCHTDPHQATLGADCESCHSAAGWHDRGLMLGRHSATLFPLTGAHTRLDCVECHGGAPPLDFVGTPVDCLSCHLNDFQATTRPSHVRAGFPTACEQCHGTTAWDEAQFGGGPNFDHDAFFVLTGAHAATDCELCHRGGQFAGTPTDCFSCHQQEYNATRDPGHAAAGFPTDCESCHGTGSWQGAVFDHTAFELVGGHRGLACESCHDGGVFAGTPTDCNACHRADYNATTDPSHAAAGFSRDCASCHDTRGWEGADIDHDRFFRLTGAHRSADCESCHTDGVFAGTPTNCNACHRADYNATTDPPHAAAGFSRNCESCHNTQRWEGADFDHDQVFRLTGAHRSADCESCHVNGVYAGTPTDCYACHQADYQATDDPNHAAAGFGTNCESCHGTSGWGGANFNHDTVFALTGAHTNLDCESCHAGGVFAGTPTDCYACHQADYEGTNDPDHVAAGFPTNCESCHSTSGWDGASFNHDQYFPINSGDHSGLDCADCHVVANNFQVFECIECHEHRQSEMDEEHDDVGGYVWESQACYDCHPTGQE